MHINKKTGQKYIFKVQFTIYFLIFIQCPSSPFWRNDRIFILLAIGLDIFVYKYGKTENWRNANFNQ